MKSCGDCSLCCKLLPVPVMASPAGEWCKHAGGTGWEGCAFHARRPAYCRSFDCLWRQSPVMGEELRPSRCGAVFEAFHQEHIVVCVLDEGVELGDAPRLLIEQMLADGYAVWVARGQEYQLFLPFGDSNAAVRARSEAIIRRMAWPHQATPTT